MTNKTNNAPFRADVVGSYLRPEKLLKARAQYFEGIITAEELKIIEDTEIIKLIEDQKKAGLQVITDGEFRRSWWHLDFFWGLNGVYKKTIAQGYVFNDEVTRGETASLNNKITGENHPFVEDYKFIHQYKEDGIVPRQTIPAPAQFYFELLREENLAEVDTIYTDKEELFNDIITAYRTVIKELYDAGCRNIQLDDCSWGTLVDPKFQQSLASEKSTCDCGHDHSTTINKPLAELQNTFIQLNNGVLYDLPTDLAITTHVCRGNYHSTWAASGGYDGVADILFGEENVVAYYLEFDTDRAGGFESLAKVSNDKKVVLGLISSKTPELENKEDIIARIHEASKYIPLERLCLSTQCGFASTEEGNKLTIEEQWAKIALVTEIANEVW